MPFKKNHIGAGEMVETMKCSQGTSKGIRVQLSGTYVKEQGHMPCVCNPSNPSAWEAETKGLCLKKKKKKIGNDLGLGFT